MVKGTVIDIPFIDILLHNMTLTRKRLNQNFIVMKYLIQDLFPENFNEPGNFNDLQIYF